MWEDMCVDVSQGYYQAMEVLEAQEQLAAFSTQDWPHWKNNQRKKIHKQLHRVAYPATHKREITGDELARLLGAGTMKKKDA